MIGKIGLLVRILVSIQGVFIGDMLGRALNAEGKTVPKKERRRRYAIAAVERGKVRMAVKPSQLLFGVLSALLLAPRFPSKLLGALFCGIGTGFTTYMLYDEMSDEQLVQSIMGGLKGGE